MPSRNQYSALPTSDPLSPNSVSNSLDLDRDHDHDFTLDPDLENDPEYASAALAARHVRAARGKGGYDRFNPPPPAPWKRAALIFFMIGLFIIGWKLRVGVKDVGPEVVHAERYSEKYKYRPAASPVITERMKDGRLLVRGAFRHEL